MFLFNLSIKRANQKEGSVQTEFCSLMMVSNGLKEFVDDTVQKMCKWKQDSVVIIFLNLDSVFKDKDKLIHNQAPVMNRLCPFLFNLHK